MLIPRKILTRDTQKRIDELIAVRQEKVVRKEDPAPDPDPAQLVAPNLYLGGLSSAFDREWLAREKIGTIINLAASEIETPRIDGIEYHSLEIYDSTQQPIRAAFPQCHKWIDDAKGPVLVHCFAGVSRSATIVISYLMRQNKWLAKDALRHVRRCRPCVGPNEGFLQDLLGYEVELGLG